MTKYFSKYIIDYSPIVDGDIVLLNTLLCKVHKRKESHLKDLFFTGGLSVGKPASKLTKVKLYLCINQYEIGDFVQWFPFDGSRITHNAIVDNTNIKYIKKLNAFRVLKEIETKEVVDEKEFNSLEETL